MSRRLRTVVRKYVIWLLLDACVVATSLVLAMGVRSITAEIVIRRSFFFGLLSIAVYLSVNHVFRLYQRIWRFASAAEVEAIGASVAVSTVLLLIIDLLWPWGRLVPFSVVLMTGFFSFCCLTAVRYRRRLWTGIQWRWRAMGGEFPVARTRMLIVGAGEAGQLLAWRILSQKDGQGYKLVGFIDDNPSKRNMRIHGVPVLGNRSEIPDLVTLHNIDLIIIAIFSISGGDFRSIVDICDRTSAAIKVLPNVFSLIRSAAGVPQIRDITTEDLLGREPVEIDRNSCRGLLAGKIVMVTGAAGSIGSELCRQILTFEARLVLMLDNNESGLFELATSLDPQEMGRFVTIIGDVTNEKKMRAVFDCHHPQVVFHAAAYKHVPLMEQYPEEAVRVNVLGTLVAAKLAKESNVERFVLVSTDKAVDPSSIMGATKRLCELLIGGGLIASDSVLPVPVARRRGHGGNGVASTVGLNLLTDTRIQPTLFTAVRFGNVLRSRGSVVPTFEGQIVRGGPVTITHREMTRYFMSISEAASLIIQAAALTEGDDVFMLDMGQEIRIDDLARRLIRLRGLRPEIDIPIVYTGIRPGEKMREVLLAEGEERFATSHPRIFRVRWNNVPDRHVTLSQIDDLIGLALSQHTEDLVDHLQAMAQLSYPMPQGAMSR